MPTLPSNVNYGQVVGQLLEAWGDGAINPGDADVLPDAKACTGTVRFTAKPTYVVDATATPNPVTIFPKVVTCKLDSNGYLLDPDSNPGVYLVADDDPDLNPTGWTWNASFNLDGIPQFSRDFSVGVGAIVDLATILGNSIPTDGGTGTIVTPSAVIDVIGRTGHVTGAQIAADPALSGTYVSPLGKTSSGATAPLGYINILDCGAIADDVTDNTAAIQGAITAAAAFGLNVYAPAAAKSYLFSNLTIPAGVTLLGDGWGLRAQAAFGSAQYNAGSGTGPTGTVLRSTATSGIAISFTSTTTANRSKGFLVVGPGSGTSTGVAFSNATSSVSHLLADIMVVNFQTCWDMGIVEDSTFMHLKARGCVTGFKLGSACNQNVWINTEVQFSSANGIYNNGGSTNKFYGGLLQNLSGNASIYHVSGEANTYDGFYCESSGSPTSLIQLDAGSSNKFRDFWQSSPVAPITLNGGGSNVFDNFDGGAAMTVNCAGGSGRLIDIKGLTVTGAAASSYAFTSNSGATIPGTRLGAGEPFRVQSGQYVYLETTGTNSFIRRNGGTGDTEIGSGSTLTKFFAASANLGLVRSGIVAPLQAKSGSYSLSDAADQKVQYTAGAATLPDPTTVITGRVFEVKNAQGTNAMNVTSAGSSKTIDGCATIVLQPWDDIQVYSDGTQWLISSGRSPAGPVLNLGGNQSSATQDIELRIDAPSTRNATLKWRYNNVDKWQMYTGSVSSSMFLRDLVNGVMALSVTAAAGTAGVATFAGVVQAVSFRPLSTVPTFAAAQTVDQSVAAIHYITMTGNITSFSVTNPRPDCEVEVHFIQDATGSRTLSGSSGIKWAGGAPTLTTTANKRDIFKFRSDGVGTMWETGRSMNVG